MTEFDKWKSKNCNIKGCPHEASCNCCEEIWKAALEWGLTSGVGESVVYNILEELKSAKT